MVWGPVVHLSIWPNTLSLSRRLLQALCDDARFGSLVLAILFLTAFAYHEPLSFALASPWPIRFLTALAPPS